MLEDLKPNKFFSPDKDNSTKIFVKNGWKRSFKLVIANPLQEEYIFQPEKPTYRDHTANKVLLTINKKNM